MIEESAVMNTTEQNRSDVNSQNKKESSQSELERLRDSFKKAAQDSWNKEFKAALHAKHGADDGGGLYTAYSTIFPPAYRDKYDPQLALKDIEYIGKVLNGENISVSIFRTKGERGESIHLRAFNKGNPLRLMDIYPVFEKFGIEVLESEALPLTPIGVVNPDKELWLNDFKLLNHSVSALSNADVECNFLEAFLKVWNGDLENGRFNGLVTSAGIPWREVQVIRAFAHYLHQIGMPFTPMYVAEALLRNSDIVKIFLALFECLFEPANESKSSDEEIDSLRERIDYMLDAVVNADDDRILRRFLNLIDSTLRTNYYQVDKEGNPRSYLSFKFDSKLVDGLPLPHPWREIFVYSPRIEGIHLRGGPVARGGLRWSDRIEDFRTEILGLVKAQMVKNSIIVPVGSKGGFVSKRLHDFASRDDQIAEGIECYKIFIRGLLDVTDNLVNSEVIAPDSVVRRDGDDPYLVVAADKGTATFSDIANGVAKEYGFWLGDAFASGGSYGYDHKAIGITARGAWESVRHHFLGMNHDIDAQEFTVVGIGDMSGDVFGNGMLLSRKICLIAAFNHKHIFIDPTPDSGISFKERERLFNAATGWESYNQQLISPGGGVFSRSLKSIPVSREMKKLFGINQDRVAPNTLIYAILKADVDLLWFGGIGTYVRSSGESDHAVGDCMNDSVRITASKLRCKVIGEGANLGITQLGRIEYGLSGGRCNADYIDNSGGVDCSDHEVNIKILLDDAIASGRLMLDERNSLLESMTQEITEDVLCDNYLQSHAISFAESFGIEGFDRYVRLVRRLEKLERLNREVEHLPTDEVLTERRKIGAGLTRAEISVMMSHGKNWLFDEVISSELPDDERLEEDLTRYFPGRLQKEYHEEILHHPLKREIISTSVVNSVVNRLGATFVAYLTERTARSAHEVVAAFIVVRKAFDLSALWEAIDNLSGNVSCAIQNDLRRLVSRFAHITVEWVLNASPNSINVKELSNTLEIGAQYINLNLQNVIADNLFHGYKNEVVSLEKRSVPAEIAKRIAILPLLASAGDVAFIARSRGESMEYAARAYFEVGNLFTLDLIRSSARKISPETPWHLRAVSSLNEQLYTCQRGLAEVVMDAAQNPKSADMRNMKDLGRIERRTQELIAETEFITKPDLTIFSVLTTELMTAVRSLQKCCL